MSSCDGDDGGLLFNGILSEISNKGFDVNEFDKWFLRYYPETKTEIRTPNTHKYKSKTVKRKKRKNKKKKKQTLRKKK